MIRAIILGAALAAMAATAAPAQSGGTLARFDSAGPRILKIACGENRSVDVSLETGAVTFRNCEANEAARVFWDSVRRMYPPRAMKAGGDNCMVYLSRVVVPALIDWRCAEEVAHMDGGDDLAKEFARALIAVRDHDYVEKK